MEPITLRTARLVLRRPAPEDAAAITVAAQDPEVPRWTTLPSPYTLRDAEEFIERSQRGWDVGTQLNWSLHRDGGWVGMLGLAHVTRGGDAEIGYWMAASARGQGLLTEAAGAVIDVAFGELDLVRIEWRATVGNIASARSARALGFRYEGMLRQGLTDPRGRHDGWIAALLRDDDRAPQDWPML